MKRQMDRICGTCALARPCGRPGEVVCTHHENRRFTVASAQCRRPRRWWRPRAELVETRDRVVQQWLAL